MIILIIFLIIFVLFFIFEKSICRVPYWDFEVLETFWVASSRA